MTASRVWLSAFCLTTVIGASLATNSAFGQDSIAVKLATAQRKAAARAAESAAFYAAAQPLEMRLTTNLRRIRGDKSENSPWRSATVTYSDASGIPVSIPTQIKTRGIWRLKNCEFPPVRLNFKAESTKGTLLKGIDKPKLVSYCRNNDDYERYITQEMQLYRIFVLLTPASHRARLLRMSYADSATGKVQATRMAILLEEPELVAARLRGSLVNIKGAVPSDLVTYQDALTAVFQYLIGNTDWSTYALHNMELVQMEDGDHVPIPYDFDFSGAIDASYATVDPSLSVQRVRERLFRGYCHKPEDFAKVFSLFNEKKSAIYALYSDSIGSMLPKKTVDATLKYFDEFYETINNPKRARYDIFDACVKTD
ncbi:MAG: hypothetical protein ABIZ36_13970 [Gemmatimonadaceae bacterium]